MIIEEIRRALLAKEKVKLEAKMADAEKPKGMTSDWLCGFCGLRLSIKRLAKGRMKLHCVKCGVSE